MRLRSARPSDHGPLLELGRRLNSINLATDAARLERQIAESQASFRGERGDRGMYLFVLEGEDGRAVGSAMILAKHGTPEEPHYYLQID
ncbi:MAG: arginine N-succinyltransferase, partial [Candidatus Methylomirabilis sp.]|nr:arginine N-succinyltransferase [Deltaproteobacteria bacterium]